MARTAQFQHSLEQRERANSSETTSLPAPRRQYVITLAGVAETVDCMKMQAYQPEARPSPILNRRARLRYAAMRLAACRGGTQALDAKALV